MADFFTQLSRRALGHEPVLQPRSQIYEGDVAGAAFAGESTDAGAPANAVRPPGAIVPGAEQRMVDAGREPQHPEKAISGEESSPPFSESRESVAGVVAEDSRPPLPSLSDKRSDATLLPSLQVPTQSSEEDASGFNQKLPDSFERSDETLKVEREEVSGHLESELHEAHTTKEKSQSEKRTVLPRLVQPLVATAIRDEDSPASAVSGNMEGAELRVESAPQAPGPERRDVLYRADLQEPPSSVDRPQFFSATERESDKEVPGMPVDTSQPNDDARAVPRRLVPQPQLLTTAVPQAENKLVRPDPALPFMPQIPQREIEREVPSRTINVTIGRIEVRATPEPRRVEYAQPPKREKAKAPSGLSLVEYLKRYNEKNG